MQRTELVYRQTAVQGASGIGMMIGLYDTLAADLRRAAEAERSDDLGKRGNAMNHAFLVIGYLEDFLRQGSGGKLADMLMGYYATMRRKMLEAQAKRSPEMMEWLMAQVLDLRKLWHEAESRKEQTMEETGWTMTGSAMAGSAMPAFSAQQEYSSSNWSA